MRKLVTFLLIVGLTVPLTSQVFDWEWQNPKPHGNTLRTIKIIDANTVIAFGAAGTVQKSTDNGATWTVNYLDPLGREFKSADFVDNLTGYICGTSGLLMKTTDGGNTFFYLNPGTDLALNDVDFIDADTGYVAGATGTLIKTTDGGVTWTPITTGITTAINAVSAPVAEKVFIGSASTSSLRRSTDYGVTWDVITPAGVTQTIWDINFLDANTGWFCYQYLGGVYRTTDGGDSWTLSNTNTLVVNNSINFRDANVGFVTNNNNGNVYKTTNGGSTWSEISIGSEPQYGSAVSGNDVFSVGRSGTTSKSVDTGDSFTLLTDAVTFTQIRHIHFFDNLNGLASAGSSTTADSLGFLMKTTDGGLSWADIGYNFKHLVYSFTTPSTNVWFVGRGRNAIFKTTDAGATFVEQTQPVTSLTAHFYDIDFIDENVGYAFSGGGEIIKTTNGGTDWVTANTPFGTTTIYAGHVFSADKVIAVGGSAKAFMTTDGGANWSAVPVGIPGNFFTVEFFNDNIGVIAGYNSPNPVASKTTDGGATWTPLSFPAEFDGNSLWAVGFKDANVFWLAGINGTIHYTMDGGDTWTQGKIITGNAFYCYSVVGNDIWLSGGNGTILKGFSDPTIPVELASFTALVSGKNVQLIWRTATELNNRGFEVERKFEGENWINIGFVPGKGTITEPSVYTFADLSVEKPRVSYRLKQVDFNGTFEYSKVIELDLGVPNKFELAQNYPNPFNPATSIKYSLASKSYVELKIYDILGKEVASLVNEIQDAGNYEVNFNAGSLSSGVYFYELSAGSFNAKKKMMLIK